MGLMEPGCKSEDFGRPIKPAVSNRSRCWVFWLVFGRFCSGVVRFGLCVVEWVGFCFLVVLLCCDVVWVWLWGLILGGVVCVVVGVSLGLVVTWVVDLVVCIVMLVGMCGILVV